MSEQICNPTTFKGLLAVIPQHSDLVAPAYLRVERFYSEQPRPQVFAVGGQASSDVDIHALMESIAGPLTPERRRAIVLGIQPSNAKGGDVEFLKLMTQRVMAGAAYLADTPVGQAPLSALYLIPRVAAQQGGAYPANVAAILRALDLHTVLDFANQQVVRICAHEGVDATVEGFARLKSESLINAIVFGLGLNLHYLVPRLGPDPWTSHLVLQGGIAIGDLNIAYFAAPAE